MVRVVTQLTLGFVLLAATVGCGASGIDVDGKVVKSGTPYSLGENESISITFTGEDGKTGTASVQPDGSFTVKDPTGKPIKAGKYKVSVIHYQMPKVKPKDGGSPPMPSAKDVGETFEVSATNKTFTLDMAKYK